MTIITQAFLPVSLAFIMLTMGLTLVPGDFQRVLAYPKAVAVGIFAQVVIIPASAFALVSLWPVDPVLAVGIMIIAACPGGVTSNLLTHLARGDTALSISLTALISLGSVVTMPLIVNVALRYFTGAQSSLPLPIGGMIIAIALVTTVPVVAGMALRHFAPGITARYYQSARKIAVGLFVLIVAGTFATYWRHFAEHFAHIGPVVLALNITAVAIGYFLPRLFGVRDTAVRTAISMECGMQNAAVGIFVAATLIGNADMIVPSTLYAFIMNVTAALLIAVRKRREFC